MSYSYVIFASGGNDSIALVQYAREQEWTNIAVAYSNTGWAASWWPLRMQRFESWVKQLGFDFFEIPSLGMEALVEKRKGWPANGMQFCTSELKLAPAKEWLGLIDPKGDAVCMVGVRREESERRRSWPLYIDESENHGNRPLYSPLVDVKQAERDELIVRAGWVPLLHRSKECSPCVNANRSDFRTTGDEEIARVETHEAKVGRNMFRPHRFKGAKGIRQVMKWAWSDRGKYEPEGDGSGCDSGMCSG